MNRYSIMRDARRFAIAIALTLGVGQAFAADRIIGNWHVSVEADRFDEKKAKAVAMVFRGASGFAVRCLSGDLSLALIEADDPASFKEGDVISAKMRADRDAIVSLVGVAISDKLVQFVTDRKDVENLQTADEIAVRVETKILRFDRLFRARGSKAAIPIVLRACGNKE